MPRSIPAFSKKSSQGPTVGGGGQRSGFTPKVTSTKSSAGKPVPHMAATYPAKSTLDRTKAKGNPAHPEFKSGSGKAGKSVAAFSKTKVSGGPKKPGIPA